MADTFQVVMQTEADPDAVWRVVGAPCGVTLWYPVYVGCRVDGDLRTLTRADGGRIVERLLTRDEARRSYTYSVIDGAPVADHHAGFEVQAREGGGATVVWTTSGRSTVEGADLEERLADRQRAALEGLRRLVEDEPRRG